MKVLITYALEEEVGDIRIPGCTLVTCCTGVGKVSAAIKTYEALQKEQPDLVLNIGTAGTLRHQVGDIVVCSRFLDRDLVKLANLGVNFLWDFSEELRGFSLLDEYKPGGMVSTGDTFLTSTRDSGAEGDVFDMESFGSAQVCKKFGLSYLSIKYVTDVIGQNSIKHWEDQLQEAKVELTEFLAGLRLKVKTSNPAGSPNK